MKEWKTITRTQKSIRKIKILGFLIVLTVILSITATYAWFSSQKDVEISSMRLNVEVAENMQISLDGEKWTQSITIEDMRQFYGTYTGNTNVHQAKSVDEEGNENYVPIELLPVSSSGTVTNGKLQFVQGEIYTTPTSKTGIKNISKCTESDLTPTETVANREDNNDNHPFMVFDMYLKNISAKAEGEKDTLKLDIGSRVFIHKRADYEGYGQEGTGLEYSARVGFVIYENNISVIATESGGKTVGEQVRELEDAASGTVAIWEPNHLEHIPHVVANNSMGITSTSQEVRTLTIKDTVTGEITDIYNSTDTTNLATPITMTPQYSLASGTIEKSSLTATDGSTELGLEANKISKVRVYIWLEGQDPDCIGMASLGDKLNVDLKLTKDRTEGLDEITYAGTGEEAGGSEPGTEDSSNGITAAQIYAMTEDEKKEIYGEYVANYASDASAAQKSVNWRIFHSDGSNIYLIADNYVPLDYVPAGRNGIAVNASSNYARAFAMMDIIHDETSANQYVGIADWDTTIKSKWLRQYTYTSTNTNVKATAYLLDKTQWSGFANSSYTEYAIGGPTLELFTASYNVTNPEKTIETQANVTGYQVRWSGGTFESNISGLSTSDSLYVISSKTNAYGMWVASPSDAYANSLMYVSNAGDVKTLSYGNTSTGLGARPLVSLKSNVKIEKIEEGKYQIVE